MKKKPQLTIYEVGTRHLAICPACSTKERRARRLKEDQRVRDMDVEATVAAGSRVECAYCGKKAQVDWLKIQRLAEWDPDNYTMPTVKEAQELVSNPWDIYCREDMTFTVELRINGKPFKTERYGFGCSPEGAARAMAQSYGETLRVLELVGKADAAEFVTTRVEVSGYYSHKPIAAFDLPLE
jgi:hypothetical protein